jgi:hypothetical protein
MYQNPCVCVCVGREGVISDKQNIHAKRAASHGRGWSGGSVARETVPIAVFQALSAISLATGAQL